MPKTVITISGLFIGFLTLTAHADVDRAFMTGTFDSIEVSQGINLNLVMGTPSSVTASADNDSDLDSLEIEVDDGVLEIRRGTWASLLNMGKSYGHVTVNIVATELQALESSSGASADLVGIVCDDLMLEASSGSKIEASGNCDTVTIEASSGAVVDSSDLITTEASAESSSGASIKVFAEERFRGDASSGSSIRVYGSPEIAESATSSGARINLRGHPQTI